MSGLTGVSPERTARVLALLSHLLHDPQLTRVPLSQLERELGLSRADILADARLVNLVNFGGGTYLLTLEQEGDDLLIEREPLGDNLSYPARLSPTLARSLLLALELVGDVVAPASTSALREKLSAALASAEAGHAGVGADRVLRPSGQVLATLGKAVRKRRLVRIEYLSAHRGDISAREVEPHILRDVEGVWYLESYCLRTRGPRTFRVDLIKSAQVLEEGFSLRPEVLEPIQRRERLAGRPQWADVAVDPSREAYLRSLGSTYSRRDDGRLGLEISYFDTEWLVGHILGGLGSMELLAPAAAREAVVQEGNALLNEYS